MKLSLMRSKECLIPFGKKRDKDNVKWFISKELKSFINGLLKESIDYLDSKDYQLDKLHNSKVKKILDNYKQNYQKSVKFNWMWLNI